MVGVRTGIYSGDSLRSNEPVRLDRMSKRMRVKIINESQKKEKTDRKR